MNIFHKFVPQGLRKGRIWPMFTIIKKFLTDALFLAESILFGGLCILVGVAYIFFSIIWELADYLIRKMER